MNKIVLIIIPVIISVVVMSVLARRTAATGYGGIRDTTGHISFVVPQDWPNPSYDFRDNQLTQDGFELGRKLFYETRLSRDSTISCASCHTQAAAFSHAGNKLSNGFGGRAGTRNSQGLFNLAWKHAYFWDGRILHLEDQPPVPIEKHAEMNLSIPEAIRRIRSDADYQLRFKTVFGTGTVSKTELFRALAQFMAALVSDDSKYDRYLKGRSDGHLSDQEARGQDLFWSKCGSCHAGPLFSDNTYRNNGLAPDMQLQDSGRIKVTGQSNDLYKFMVPSLRNVELTPPYMHDGRFGTLESVLDHYRSGIFHSATLDPGLQQGISMTDADTAAIIQFLKTLSDQRFIHDRRFANP